MEEIIYLNGTFVPRSQAKLSPFDYGFLHGYGLFETMRAYSGHIFALDQHLDRLYRSAELLHLNLKADRCCLREALRGTLQANGLKDARLRLTVSGGEGTATPNISSCETPIVVIFAVSYAPRPQKEGLSAIISSFRRNSRSPLSGVKSLSTVENLLAQNEARAAGANLAIMLNEQNHLSEGNNGNLFLVSKGTLLTPDKASGILPGVTRRVVIEIASSMGIEVIERTIDLDELLQAEESFLTNSVIEIAPLTQVAGITIGSGKTGKITKKLIQSYAKLVHKERVGNS